jgi:hypothetical protein
LSLIFCYINNYHFLIWAEYFIQILYQNETFHQFVFRFNIETYCTVMLYGLFRLWCAQMEKLFKNLFCIVCVKMNKKNLVFLWSKAKKWLFFITKNENVDITTCDLEQQFIFDIVAFCYGPQCNSWSTISLKFTSLSTYFDLNFTSFSPQLYLSFTFFSPHFHFVCMSFHVILLNFNVFYCLSHYFFLLF